jgi:D-alanine-D-alanine ligase
MRKHVAVLMGGWSKEREVSLTSAQGIVNALHELGHQVTAIDVTRDIPKLIRDLTPRPDVVLNILHGKYGEDGHIQSVLDILGLPYTFSDACASAVAMDKNLSKKLFQASGLSTPNWQKAPKEQVFSGQITLPMPYVVKPFDEGSSVGVFIINSQEDLHRACQEWQYNDALMIEEYIAGKELSVAIINGKAIGVLELRPTQGFYDYNAKYTDGVTEHIMPAAVSPDIYQLALKMSESAYQVIGCSGIARADFRYDPERVEGDQLHILEMNTQPGMTPLSIVPDIAAHTGITFNQLVQMMIEDAVCSEKCA